MLPAFPILLSVFSSLWGVSSPLPVPETTLNSNVVAPAATPPPWKDEVIAVIAHVPIHNILDPAVSTPPNTFAVHPTISGTDTPTNYPTKITSIVASTEPYEGTDLNPLGGEGYSIWTHITAKTRYTVEQRPARVTSVPYQVQRSVEETTKITVFITQYLTGYPPRLFITGGTVTDSPYTSYTMLSTATSTLNENPRVLEFSLTSFPTSITETYTSTSILTIQGVHTTKVVVDTITQSWSAQPTSFPYTLTQTAITRTWRADKSISFGLRTFRPTFIVGSIPTSLAASEQVSPGPDKTQNDNHNLKAPLGKRYNSIYPLAFEAALWCPPQDFPIKEVASHKFMLE
ncbi:hypothetical protein V8F06_012571 [Rhypophila decipiens]